MKKLPPLSLEKLLVLCGFSLAVTVAGFWHHHQNARMTQRMGVLQQGLGTCFARVNQTFTAAMIREARSTYLQRDFMSLSEECFREGVNASREALAYAPKLHRLYNDLISEAHWFHEKAIKAVGNPLAIAREVTPLNALQEKYGKVEGIKLDLADQLDAAMGSLQAARGRDEVLVGSAFFVFLAALGALAMREVRRLRALRAVEKQALSLLNTGNANVGAMVDQLVSRALAGQGMNITLQVFRDYHGDLLERMHGTSEEDAVPAPVTLAPVAASEPAATAPVSAAADADFADTNEEVDIRRLLVNQATRLRAPLDVQDAMVPADGETLAQVLQVMAQRFQGWHVRLSGTRADNTYQVGIDAEGVCLNSSELEYASTTGASNRGVDMNVVMAVDLARAAGIPLRLENRVGEDGSIAGARATMDLAMPNARTLTAVVRGKKRDLERRMGGAPEMMN